METLPFGAILLLWLLGAAVLIWPILRFIGVRLIGNDEVGIVEKIWSTKGSLDGQIIALNGEAGYQPEMLRGGIHFVPGWQFRVHKYPLLTIHRGQIGYVFARDGKPLSYSAEHATSESGQTLGRVVAGGDFTDVRKFLGQGGQKGPQRGILREGTYAINLAQFIVITGKDQIHYLPLGDKHEDANIKKMAYDLESMGGFQPVLIAGSEDHIGIVTVHDGPSLPKEDIIAPTVGDRKELPHYHNNFQDPEAFLAAGGYRGRQYQVLTEGTYFINRLFASIELKEKTVVPVGHVGVVVSYYGEKGKDTSGEAFKHGELCEVGERGVWRSPLMPGKYPFNTYAGIIMLVPTTNIILKWVEGEQGSHNFDEHLSEVSLITRDAFEPLLPLSVVIHIDYMKAPSVIQRFGNVKMLVEQTLDPMVSSYFKNEGQKRTLIELIQNRSEIQDTASQSMKTKFLRYDLELEEVLIGTPHSPAHDDRIEKILVQLRDRQIAEEQQETYRKQEEAEGKRMTLNAARAKADRQTALSESEIDVQIQVNQGKAQAARAEQEAKKTVTLAAADAEASARTGIGQAIGVAELQKAYGDPRLMVAKEVGTRFCEAIASGKIAIVPQTLMQMGGSSGENSGGTNVLSELLTLFLADRMGLVDVKPGEETNPEVERMKKQIMEPILKEFENPKE